jgi:succinate dehydrogenase/fumarate reductase flavoprotein subunit
LAEKSLELNPGYAKTKVWKAEYDVPKAFLLLSKEAAETTSKHVDFYIWKGLLKKIVGLDGLATHLSIPAQNLQAELDAYERASALGRDDFGKDRFPAVPGLHDAEYVVGIVTPVLHYCMGGLAIDHQGCILDKRGNAIPGLLACGETSGGVHGDNRLAGNSLLECAVFGRIVGQTIDRELKAASEL